MQTFYERMIFPTAVPIRCSRYYWCCQAGALSHLHSPVDLPLPPLHPADVTAAFYDFVYVDFYECQKCRRNWMTMIQYHGMDCGANESSPLLRWRDWIAQFPFVSNWQSLVLPALENGTNFLQESGIWMNVFERFEYRTRESSLKSLVEWNESTERARIERSVDQFNHHSSNWRRIQWLPRETLLDWIEIHLERKRPPLLGVFPEKITRRIFAFFKSKWREQKKDACSTPACHQRLLREQ